MGTGPGRAEAKPWRWQATGLPSTGAAPGLLGCAGLGGGACSAACVLTMATAPCCCCRYQAAPEFLWPQFPREEERAGQAARPPPGGAATPTLGGAWQPRAPPWHGGHFLYRSQAAQCSGCWAQRAGDVALVPKGAAAPGGQGDRTRRPGPEGCAPTPWGQRAVLSPWPEARGRGHSETPEVGEHSQPFPCPVLSCGPVTAVWVASPTCRPGPHRKAHAQVVSYAFPGYS